MIAPNFSRMRVKSEVFYVPLADLYKHFHDTIMNYKEESSEVIENGTKTTFSFSKLPYIRLNSLSSWLSTTPSAVNSAEDFYGNLQEQTFLQTAAVARLVHQMGVPFDVAPRYIYGGTDINGIVILVDNPYCSDAYFRGDDDSTNPVTRSVSGQVPISLFPFQAYQYCYNWYYRDSVRSPEIDCYPDVYSINSNSYFDNILNGSAGGSQIQSIYMDSSAIATQKKINHFFNSLFQVRRRFYRKDYFNTAVGDPTVGVDSISVPDNIVDLRKANQLQKFIEKQALAGNRIAEFIMAHWAYKSDDYELGRPILISSSSQNVQISEVLQTSQTTDGDGGSAQGSRSGVANSYGSSNGSYFVSPDYGILLINMSIVPEISYFSGTPRKLTPYRWEHFPWPEFAQIGMQPIYDFELGRSRESAVSGTLFLEDFTVFGYSPRYSEFKMELDQISGELATSLRYWHQSPSFDYAPGLNSSFGLIGLRDYNQFYNRSQVSDLEYYNQIFAVQDDQLVDHCQVVGMFDISVNRALPYNDMPAL